MTARRRSVFRPDWALRGPALVLCLLIVISLLFAADFLTSGQLERKAGSALQRITRASERFRILLFGPYPYEEQWRALAAGVILVCGFGVIFSRSLWVFRRLSVLIITVHGLAACLLLGGPIGLPYVGTEQWGGLVLTLFVYSSALSIGVPTAIALAIARLLAPRPLAWIISFVCDLIRSIPLAVVLLGFVLLVPYLSAAHAGSLRLFSAVSGFVIYFSIYMSEVFLAGMASVRRNQVDAATALGFNKLLIVRLIIIPQALVVCLPAAMNEVRIALKETSVLCVVGIMELAGSTRAAHEAGRASESFLELYLISGALYASILYMVSLIGVTLESEVPAWKPFDESSGFRAVVPNQVDRA